MKPRRFFFFNETQELQDMRLSLQQLSEDKAQLREQVDVLEEEAIEMRDEIVRFQRSNYPSSQRLRVEPTR